MVDSFHQLCDGMEEVFVSCFTGIIVGVCIFGGMCFCVIKNKCCFNCI